MIRTYLLLCLLGGVLGFLVACAGVTPKDQTQIVYSIGWTLVGAENSVADLKQSGVLKGSDLDNAKTVLAQAESAYQSARTAKSPADAATYIRLAQSLLNQLAAYLASKQQ